MRSVARETRLTGRKVRPVCTDPLGQENRKVC
jgi:hypothetical protein